MNDRVADSVPFAARGVLLVLVVCLHAAGAAALSRLSGPSWRSEEPPILRASWIELASSPPSSSVQPAEAHPVPPPPRPARTSARRVRPEVRPQAIRSEPAPEIVDTVPDVPVDVSGDSIPVPHADVSAAAAVTSESSGGGEERSRGEEEGWGRDYVGPDSKANYLFNPKPEYPPLSRRLNEQGVVKLRVYITEEGRAGEVELKESSGYERLDRSALNSVKHWRFQPAQRAGTPVASWRVMSVRFGLQG